MPVIKSLRTYRVGKHKWRTVRLYKAYQNMLARVSGSVHDGTGRARWKGLEVGFKDFDDFRAWSLANGFRRGMALDRINEKLGYTKENSQWITIEANNAKARNVHKPRCKCVYCRAKRRNGYES